jgi:aspartyl-tRNA(Asn)/glutamyl-tRNA(Gln) amidotransferase subunit C
MSIDNDTVRKVAHLARISLRDEEVAPLAAELNSILGWVEQLGQVDVSGVEPMTSVTPMALKQRADEVTDGDRQADILANAPDAREGFFTVPKVVE